MMPSSTPTETIASTASLVKTKPLPPWRGVENAGTLEFVFELFMAMQSFFPHREGDFDRPSIIENREALGLAD